MNKYYIVKEDVMDDVFTTDIYSIITKIDNDSIILHTEMTIEELREYLSKIPPKNPY